MLIRFLTLIGVLIFAVLNLAVAARPGAANTLVPHAGLRPLTAAHLGTVYFRIKVPRPVSATPHGLRPRYISVSTRSFAIATDFINPVAVNVDATTGYATAYVHAAVGEHSFGVTAYDRPGAQGKVLSLGSVDGVVVPPTGSASAFVTLGGVVASVVLTLGRNHATRGSAALIDLRVIAKDADGNVIIAGSPFAFGITLTTSDPVNGKLSQTIPLLSAVDEEPQDGQRIRVAYSGASAGTIVFSATGYGLASVTPAVLAPLAPPPAPSRQIIVIGGFDPNSAFSTSPGNQLLATLGFAPDAIYQNSYRAGAVDEQSRLAYVTHYLFDGTNPSPDIDVFQTGGAYALVDSFRPLLFTAASLTIDAAAKKLYAADINSRDIFVFSTARGHVLLRVIRIGLGGADGPLLAVDPLAARLYVSADGSAGGLTALSTADGSVVGTLAAGPHGPVGVDPGAKRLYAVSYAPDYSAAYVDAYDTVSSARIARIGPFTYATFPRGLAVDVIGRRLYVLVPQGDLPPYGTQIDAYALDAQLAPLGSFSATSGAQDIILAPFAP